jgi:hypothetical protein
VNRPIGPGQKRSSSERNWLAVATLVRTRSSRARVSALSAFVSSLSGSSTRKRRLSVRASSHSTNASNRSDLPPETRKRARVAATWLGCSASTRSPASNSRSTSSPSGRSIATNTTFSRTSCRHSARTPLLIMRERGRKQLLARLVGHQQSCLSAAQSTPA